MIEMKLEDILDDDVKKKLDKVKRESIKEQGLKRAIPKRKRRAIEKLARSNRKLAKKVAKKATKKAGQKIKGQTVDPIVSDLKKQIDLSDTPLLQAGREAKATYERGKDVANVIKENGLAKTVEKGALNTASDAVLTLIPGVGEVSGLAKAGASIAKKVLTPVKKTANTAQNEIQKKILEMEKKKQAELKGAEAEVDHEVQTQSKDAQTNDDTGRFSIAKEHADYTKTANSFINDLADEALKLLANQEQTWSSDANKAKQGKLTRGISVNISRFKTELRLRLNKLYDQVAKKAIKAEDASGILALIEAMKTLMSDSSVARKLGIADDAVYYDSDQDSDGNSMFSSFSDLIKRAIAYLEEKANQPSLKNKNKNKKNGNQFSDDKYII